MKLKRAFDEKHPGFILCEVTVKYNQGKHVACAGGGVVRIDDYVTERTFRVAVPNLKNVEEAATEFLKEYIAKWYDPLPDGGGVCEILSVTTEEKLDFVLARDKCSNNKNPLTRERFLTRERLSQCHSLTDFPELHDTP